MSFGEQIKDSLGRIYSAILADDVAYFISIVIVVIFVLSILSRLPILHRLLNAFDRSGAALMTTIGVLGTFTGIFIGLLNFDVSAIDDSVPQLLEGLKIAFSTSIVGLSGASVFKIVQAITPRPGISNVTVTPEMIHATLRSVEDAAMKSSEKQQELLEGIQGAIAKDNESSVLTQLQKLRTTIQDGQQDFIKEFRSFAQTMAENNSKAMIEALEQVIRDFNTQLNEQFGENFKHLNEAVFALVNWQENYRRHLEALEERIESATAALESAEQSLRAVAEHTKRIPEMLKPLESLLEGLQTATVDLEAHLSAVGALKEQAVNAFPVIEQNLQVMTEGVGAAVDASIRQMASMVAEQRDALDSLRKGYDELSSTAADAQNIFSKALEKAMDSVHASLSKAMDGHAQAIDVTAKEMQRLISEAWTRTGDNINKQIQELDNQMQVELTRTIEVMGQKLASLSEKFVKDYEPLTERLRSILQIAESRR